MAPMVNGTSPCVEDSVVVSFGQRLSDLILGEAAQHAQPRHGELAPRISSDLIGEDGCFCRYHLCTPVMQYQTCYELGF